MHGQKNTKFSNYRIPIK